MSRVIGVAGLFVIMPLLTLSSGQAQAQHDGRYSFEYPGDFSDDKGEEVISLLIWPSLRLVSFLLIAENWSLLLESFLHGLDIDISGKTPIISVRFY